MSVVLAGQNLLPVYNPSIWVQSSTAITENNFLYIFDVWDMTANERISRIKIPADPNGEGVYDAHKVLETITTYYVPENVTNFYAVNNHPEINNICKYQVRAGEEFEFHWPFHYVTSGASTSITSLVNTANTTAYYAVGDIITITPQSSSLNPQLSGTFTVLSSQTFFGSYYVQVTNNPTTPTISQFQTGDTTWSDQRSYANMSYSSSTLFAFNGAETFNDFPTWDWSRWAIDAVYQGKFLTTVPNDWKFNLESKAYFNFWSNSLVGNSKWLVIQTDNGSKYKIDNSYPSCQHAIVGVGPANLNTSTLSFGSQPVITSSTKRYSAWTESTTSGRTSEVKTFTMNTDCTNNKYTSYQLIWLDRKGSWISHIFDLASKRKVQINKKNYKSLIGAYDSSTIAWTYKPSDRGQTTLNVDLTETITVTSNWMNQTNGDYLEELFSSPAVYHIKDGVWVAIDIKSNTFENKYRNTNKLINYSLDFEYSNPNEVQRG